MEGNTAKAVNKSYELAMSPNGYGYPFKYLFDKIGFFNVGYWKGIDNSIERAQIALIEELVSFLSNRDGNILDVACGKGVSTKFLTKYFDVKAITGINISETQLTTCKSFAPECNFELMDATNLTFADSTFDNVLCIEAAFHFFTRFKFLQEAHRVLRPGGKLAISDILLDRPVLDPVGPCPDANYLPNLDAYRASLNDIGFKYVRVEDSTEFATDALRRFQLGRAEKEFLGAKQEYAALEKFTTSNNVIACCMVYAIK